MAETEIIDLSDLLSEPKRVRFEPNGPVYKFPGDIDTELWLRLQQFAREGTAIDAEVVEYLHDELLAMAQAYQPDLTVLPAKLPQIIRAIGRIYGEAPVVGDEDGPPPNRATRRAARATSGGAGSSTSARKRASSTSSRR